MNGELDTRLQSAVSLHGQGLPEQAALLYAQILRDQPGHTDALHLLGVAETQLGRPRSGLEWIGRSLQINPNQPAAIANRGNAFLALNEASQALACYDATLLLWPDYSVAVYGRGNALLSLGKPAEALSCFERALALTPSFLQAAIAAARALRQLERPSEALVLCEDALQIAPRSAETHAERGHVLAALGRTDAAIKAYDRALELGPALALVWFSRGIALAVQSRFVEAAASLREALQVNPALPFARGACLHAELQVCDWRDHAAAVAAITSAPGRDESAEFPFPLLAVCDSPSLQLKCARRFADSQRSGRKPIPAGARRDSSRIRIAYISADFLEHPTSYLMAGVFEKHDRKHFEILGISLRNEDPLSPTAGRVKAAFERFVPADNLSDQAVARLLRDLEVDVAVDLMGYTGEHRAGIFAYRPAMIQVNYLGFPSTSGSPDIDYLIADEFLIPETERNGYSECIAYLPESFQANDDRRPGTVERPERAHMRLPTKGPVLCSFHSRYKFNPPLFDIWSRLLLAVPGAVLWLTGGNAIAEANLRREALARGIQPERIVFAEHLPYPQHLARLGLADLCLDTFPFNGGATTSDALWAGVPVVTCSGKGYAARMSGSLLHALGLPELATSSLEEYERLALLLADSPKRLADMRAAVARQRQSSPLFDTERFCRHLEAAYTMMLERQGRGLAPATFSVPALAQ